MAQKVIKIEELKRRWVKKPVIVTFPERTRHGGKRRREEDLIKLMKLSKTLFESRFEKVGNVLVFKSMYETQRTRHEELTS
ncbi:hypothetical protein IPA_02815 [Ignicoccus pacificus DSM 13166]|uniref:Uncharacterized protein n=1 Tax=Ignicoccus pacificus DSM 13166 TaxID=940294 RepID=A0A977KAS7_9CREN|nr:hypothetical protein IPA_02815 [Ignicoccus pacificus DSM 13166]